MTQNHPEYAGLTSVQRMHQEDHNRRHPGKICRTCPVEMSGRARLQAEAERAQARVETGIELAFVIFIIAMVFLLLAVFA